VRILAATNCDLTEAIAAGRFREDLFFRLSGLQIHLPPLRHRREDIGPLCKHFLTLLGQDRLAEQIDDALIESLAQRTWRGNVRELRNAVEHAAVVARGRTLSIDDFPSEQLAGPGATDRDAERLRQAAAEWIAERLSHEGVATLHADLIAEIEPVLFRAALQHTGNNRAAAAELLGIHRGTLREKLKGYGIGDASGS
jgi:two-component system nitrogen regulation response regulator GlnG